MISVLIPTRNRPQWLTRTVESIRATAISKIEICLYIDDDDKVSVSQAETLGVRYRVGPRTTLSECWNLCCELSTGEIFMHGNDDLIFRTSRWDKMVESFFETTDGYWFAHGNDGQSNSLNFGTAGFLHRKWVEAVGYFTPPYFCSDYADTWLNDVANLIGRRKYLPFLIEHMHYAWGKAPLDSTYEERLERHATERPGDIYKSSGHLRRADANKLLSAIKGELMPSTKPKAPKWSILILTQPKRDKYLQKLLDRLKPQVIPVCDQVEIVVSYFDPSNDIGTNRFRMIQKAKGEYVCFVDDDDLVAEDYVDQILPLLDGVDYIGFQLQLYNDGVKAPPTFHSLKYSDWNADQAGYYRDISHLNPIRRELAIQVPMAGGNGEDQRWAHAMREKGIVKTEHYVDAVMYHYLYRSTKEEDARGSRPMAEAEPPVTQKRICPNCGSDAIGMGGGMRNCNQCGHRF